jgi:hypothetical protein
MAPVMCHAVVVNRQSQPKIAKDCPTRLPEWMSDQTHVAPMAPAPWCFVLPLLAQPSWGTLLMIITVQVIEKDSPCNDCAVALDPG